MSRHSASASRVPGVIRALRGIVVARRSAWLAALLAATVLPWTALHAQGGEGDARKDEGASADKRTPVLLLQPGMLSADFVSAPPGYPATSGFNLRFATLVPSESKWWTLIVGASVTPYGTSGITPRNTNTPVLFIGNVFPAVSAQAMHGWFDLSFPVYLTYSYGGGGQHNRKIYGKDVVAEGALQLYIGRKILKDLGPAFSRLRLYVMVNQVVTPNADPTTGVTDRFNPTALYGLTIPIGRSER